MTDIVGLDMPCLDLNVGVDAFPRPNEGGPIRQIAWQGGGKVATGLAAAGRLGASCAIIGAVGDDLYGRFCLKDFHLHSVNTGRLRVQEGQSTSLSVVLSDREYGGRSILGKPGSCAMPPMQAEDIALITDARCLFIASADDIRREAAQAARQANVKVLMDTDSTDDQTLRLLPLVDILIASEFFQKALYGGEDYEAQLRDLTRLGPPVVLFTLGERGCAGLSPQGYFRLPAHPVDTVDTVGAGDVFHGAFAAAYTRGADAREAARYAGAVSAIKCMYMGGRAGIPNDADTRRFLLDGTIPRAELDERAAFYERGLEYVP